MEYFNDKDTEKQLKRLMLNIWLRNMKVMRRKLLKNWRKN